MIVTTISTEVEDVSYYFFFSKCIDTTINVWSLTERTADVFCSPFDINAKKSFPDSPETLLDFYIYWRIHCHWRFEKQF